MVVLDLGSTMTRFCLVDGAEVFCQPTVLLHDDAGSPVAAGWAAWHMALHEPYRLRYPVLGGVVFDVVACANMLRLLFAEAGMSDIDGVAVGVPAVATREDLSLLSSVVRAATGAPVVAMRPALAAAAGRELPAGVLPTGLVCDVGASVVEVGAFHRGGVSAQVGTKVRTHAFLDEPELVVGELLRLVHEVLGKMPGTVVGELVGAPVSLVGGAQRSQPLLERLYTSLHLDLSIDAAPETAVVSGLAHGVEATPHRTQY